MTEKSSTDLADLLGGARVIVTAGTGGVGKTTLASAIGMAQAMRGRRCVVVTIDPAKRLAETLGLTVLDNSPRRVSIEVGTGELWACMLDTKTTFDEIIQAEATPQQADAILSNRLYTNISGSLSGTQEYMAAEKVHQLVSDQRFDVVVIDTPPAANALDFVTAPRRLVRFLDHSLFRLVIAPGKGALRFVSGAAQTLLKPLTQVIGGAAVTDAIEFFRLFDGLEAGFRKRASESLEVLTDPATAWVLVATAEPEPLRAAEDFAERIQQVGITVSGVVLNRAEPHYDGLPAKVSGRSASSIALNGLIVDHRDRCTKDDLAVARLRTVLPAALPLRIERFDPNLDDREALGAVARYWT
jgi:anion-transporting  ArsA/GET3 family ATPase